MLRKILKIILLTFSTSVLSTTFIPLSLDKQMENASGVLKAEFIGLEYKKVSNDRIITEATFKMIESVGIKQSEIINKNNFKVIYPGGKWQNLDYRVSGAPTFSPGEETMLILKKTSLGHAVKGLGMGKYEIETGEKGTFYKSSVFPDHSHLGKISSKKFEEAIYNRFGSAMEKVKSDKFVSRPIQIKAIDNEFPGRSPASTDRSIASTPLDNSEESTGSNPFWIVVLFSFLGAMSVYTVRRSKRNK